MIMLKKFSAGSNHRKRNKFLKETKILIGRNTPYNTIIQMSGTSVTPLREAITKKMQTLSTFYEDPSRLGPEVPLPLKKENLSKIYGLKLRLSTVDHFIFWVGRSADSGPSKKYILSALGVLSRLT